MNGCHQVLYKSRLCAGTGRYNIIITSTGERVTTEGDITAGGSRSTQPTTYSSNTTDLVMTLVGQRSTLK